MSYEPPPRILRIKRKRFQDPLQALVLEDRRGVKRSKPSTPVSSQAPSPSATPARNVSTENLNYIFKLARTDALTGNANVDETILQSVLSEASFQQDDQNDPNKTSTSTPTTPSKRTTRKRKFIIPSRQTEEDVVIPNELSDMLNSFLTVDKQESSNVGGSGHRKRRTRASVGNTSNEITDQTPSNNDFTTDTDIDTSTKEELSEYVYDVYQLTSTEPLTTANHPQSQIGYIRFFDDDDDNFYDTDEDELNKPTVFSDDEDSNAEDFYQNDYPSDEDAGAFSETNSLGNEDEDEDEEDDIENSNADPLAEFVEDDEEGGNFELQDDEIEDYGDMSYLAEDDYYDGDQLLAEDDYNFKRNHFFEGDEDDEMAIHRDRIFGKLEKMINETH
ncbi:uncharacterized protein RJT20DRAFT_31306 [Scheffersomyces xylosifermentans]|uniref:uncharacterized protein n=1 Tax=Scheffersomyces xylosifermentans TaxID=1304137 RepID=UPI00315CA0E1